MQVLLLKDVDGLGHAGDIKEVAGGYAQNYLIPRKLANPVSAGALKQAKVIREAVVRRQEKTLNEARALANRIEGTTLTFTARAGEGDRLYGSITSGDIAEALAKVSGLEIERRSVEIEHPLKDLGTHDIPIRLAAGVAAEIHVQVARLNEEA